MPRPRRLLPEVAACGVAMAAALLLAAVALKLWDADLHVPFEYGGDGVLNQIVVKAMLDHGWYQHNSSLAAPFGQTLLDFPVYSGETLQFLIMKAIGIFSSNSAVVINVFFLLTFPLTALTSYVVLRLLGIGRCASVAVAVLFAIAPYHFLRGEYHLFIAAYYAVPLGLFLALAVMLGRPLLPAPGSAPRARAARWALLVAATAVIGSAHVYYAAFTLVLLAAAIVLRLLAHGRDRVAIAGVLCAGLIATVVVANHLPNIVYAHSHGANKAILRDPADSERFGLRLAEMALPVPHHRIEALADLRDNYTPESDQVHEGNPQALGIIATLGLVWLFLVLVLGSAWQRVRSWGDELQLAAARLAAVAFITGTAGGVSAFIAYFLTDQLRAWGRISIMLAFLGLIPVAAALDRASRRWGAPAVALAAALLVVVGFLDQTNASSAPAYGDVAASYASDRAVVRAAQAELPANAAVFELPFEPFPEPQPQFTSLAVGPYDLGRPYLHSSDLRWSYGAMKGRADAWQNAAVGLPPALLSRALAAIGFKGIVVDRGAYTDSGQHVIGALEAETGAPAQSAPGGRLVFFSLRSYAERLLAGRPPAARERLRHALLTPLSLTFAGGFSAPRQSDGVVWRYAAPGTAQLALANPGWTTRSARLAVTLAAPQGRHVTVRLRAGRTAARVVQAGPAGKRVTLAPGTTTVALAVQGRAQSNLPDVSLPYDLLVENPVLEDDALATLGTAPADQLSSQAGSPFLTGS